MEGYLLKWTNYIRGWQQRWFVLKDGVLSYYNNQNDSINGDCKRSFKISMFEIIVNKSDSSRVDLILPNEQYLYLKAADIKERQKWLVALASQKATFPLNNLPQMITGASSSATGDLDSSDPKMQNMTGIFDSTHLLKIKQSELRFYCDLLTQQTHEVKNLLLNVASPSSPSSNATAVVVKVSGETSGSEKRKHQDGDSSPKTSSSSGGGGTTSPSLDIIKNSENKSSEGLSGGYVSASSSFKSLTPTSTGHHSSSSDSEMTTAASTSSRQQSLDISPGGDATKTAAANNGPSDREEDSVAVNATSTLNSSTNTVVDERPASTGPRSIAVDEDFIKKLDDVSSNINMTCDMLMQIIRNLILLSNTSTNVGPEALKSLLASVAAESGSTSTDSTAASTAGAANTSATTPKTPKSPLDPFKADLEQYKYHLYHPMYMNNQLNQYNTKNLPVSSGGGGGSASRGGHLYDFSQLNQQQQHHHTK